MGVQMLMHMCVHVVGYFLQMSSTLILEIVSELSSSANLAGSELQGLPGSASTALGTTGTCPHKQNCHQFLSWPAILASA